MTGNTVDYEFYWREHCMKWRRRKHGKCRKHRNTMYTMGTMYTMKVMMETMEGDGDNGELWRQRETLE